MPYQHLADRVFYEDNHLIVVNKLPSEIIQGDKTGDQTLGELVKLYLKEKYNKPGDVFLGTVHRIDRPVSGLIIFARTSKALKRMNELIKKREIKKTYWAIVKKAPPENSDTLIHYLRRDQSKNKSYAYDKVVDNSKEARLSYLVLAKSEGYFLLHVNLQTGRHHQIRVQLAKIGCPIKGDLKYGFPRSNDDASVSLHARSISFLHPVKNEMISLVADPPDDVLWNYFVMEASRL